ncbi:hypothetical protein [Picosynechococcus sp. PCC 7003]|uniref:hypothetical protein n=1 Tax=Picosynechococcus sp. PCC 7003 TaxID=374981 RepID=UPI001E63D19A|nr:hypothetical protein [Picosynechococcus sp. PCC 7003]
MVSQTSLFHEKTLRQAVKSFIFPEDLEQKHGIIQKWVKTEASGTLTKIKETSLHGEFLGDIFREVLGYKGITTGEGEAWEIHPEKMLMVAVGLRMRLWVCLRQLQAKKGKSS